MKICVCLKIMGWLSSCISLVLHLSIDSYDVAIK